MNNQRSDGQNKSASAYKRSVRAYLLAHDEVASKQELRAGTDVPAWYIDQIGSTTTFYTSLNHDRDYVASKHLIGHRSTHDGFWRPQVDDGVAVFHCKEDTKPTLKHLAFKRPSGLTAAEANDCLDRRCYRPLRQLAEQDEVHVSAVHDTTVYTHRWPSLQDAQLSQRETDQPTDVSPPDPADDSFLYRDELLEVFRSAADDTIHSTTATRAAALVLRQFEGDSFEALERRLRRNHSLQDALDYSQPGDVPDGTSSGEPSTISTRTNSAIACSRCVARCSTITSTAVSSS